MNGKNMSASIVVDFFFSGGGGGFDGVVKCLLSVGVHAYCLDGSEAECAIMTNFTES